MNGQIDEHVVTGGTDDPRISDVEISNFIEQGTEVLITVVKTGEEILKTQSGGAFSKCLNLTLFLFIKTWFLNMLIETTINITDYV